MHLRSRRRAATLVEYGLIAVLVVILAVPAVGLVGGTLNSQFSSVTSAAAGGAAGGSGGPGGGEPTPEPTPTPPASGTLLFSEDFDADSTPDGWSGLATNYLQAGAARTADGSLGLSPEFAVSEGDLLSMTAFTDDNSGSATDTIGFCFRETSGEPVSVGSDCVYTASNEMSSSWNESQFAAFVPTGVNFATVYFQGNQHYDSVEVTLGPVLPTGSVLDSATWDAGAYTDGGFVWPMYSWSASAGVGGTGAMTGGNGQSRWYAVGPDQIVTLTIDVRTNSGSAPYYTGLQVGKPGDALCGDVVNDAACSVQTGSITSSYQTKTVTVMTTNEAQWVRFFKIGSQRHDNMLLEIQ